MTYSEATQFLFNQLPMYQRQGQAAYKADLETTHQLDNYFNHPHKHYKTIHIAGTNGKGSVSHMLASVLKEAGYKVGLYTSPHLKDFRERIKVNGKTISEEQVVNFVSDHSKIIMELSPSFFEMTVAMALDYFRMMQVDIAVIEVGLGGRLDSTNIINPILSIITNIDLDHTQFLGNKKSLIAREKSGIIKPNSPLIIGETDHETIEIFRSHASEKSASLIQADQLFSIPYSTFSLDEKQIMQVYSGDKLSYKNLKVSLLGNYQRKNTITVLAALKILMECNLFISDSHIYKGLENVQSATGLMGRWQIIGNNPRIICDTGHNTAGIKELMEQIKQTPHQTLHIIWGMVRDKDIHTILPLLPINANYYFTKAAIPRSLDEIELWQEAKKYGLIGSHHSDVPAALQSAQKNAGVNDLIFIGGSTFVVADVL